jgi:hypothetical protein
MAHTHPVHRVIDFEIVGPYRLRVTFADGVTRTIDFRPVLRGELYGPLRDMELFEQVALDREVHTLVWPNGADFDPATLYDWPELADDFADLAGGWDEAEPTRGD